MVSSLVNPAHGEPRYNRTHPRTIPLTSEPSCSRRLPPTIAHAHSCPVHFQSPIPRCGQSLLQMPPCVHGQPCLRTGKPEAHPANRQTSSNLSMFAPSHLDHRAPVGSCQQPPTILQPFAKIKRQRKRVRGREWYGKMQQPQNSPLCFAEQWCLLLLRAFL